MGAHSTPANSVSRVSVRRMCITGLAQRTISSAALVAWPSEMRKGDKVAMWYISANRDETHFSDPYRFDIAREPNEQGGFGTGGPHFCLGAHLARREITVMFTELLRRLPDIEATARPEKLRSNFIHGIKRLPAAFMPARG